MVSGEFAPLAGTVEEPLTAALVFGYTDDQNYWLAGAKCWTAVPDGGGGERLHLRYFVARVKDGEFEIREQSAEPEVLPADAGAFKLRIAVHPTVLELSRSYAGQDWDSRLTAANPWSLGSMPASKFGFYSDRQPLAPADPPEPLEPAPCLFDDLQVEWATAALQKASYAYHTYNGFRTHMLSQVTGLGLDAAYTYDADGNRLTKTAGANTHTFGYTFENRLQSVKKNGATIRSYAFQGDSWMKRTATEVNDGVTATRKLLYDGSNLLAEFNGSGELQAHYAVTGLDSALWTMRRSPGGSYDFSTPLSGAQNVIATAGADGQITARYRYQAFGKRFTLSGTDPARRDPTFQNRTYDAGLGIYDYRNRSFDPATGRFLQRDPVLDEANLYNPYTFPGNNPVGNVDPMGLGFWEEFGKWMSGAWDVYWRGFTIVGAGARQGQILVGAYDFVEYKVEAYQGARIRKKSVGEALSSTIEVKRDLKDLYSLGKGFSPVVSGNEHWVRGAYRAYEHRERGLGWEESLARASGEYILYDTKDAPILGGPAKFAWSGYYLFTGESRKSGSMYMQSVGQLGSDVGLLVLGFRARAPVRSYPGRQLPAPRTGVVVSRGPGIRPQLAAYRDLRLRMQTVRVTESALGSRHAASVARLRALGGLRVASSPTARASLGERVVAGEAGEFAALRARAVPGDLLTPHHMPQTALRFTPRPQGGALVMTAEEHALTRTFGARGIVTARQEANLSFRTVLAHDIRDVRLISGRRYNPGIRDLLDYYRRRFPELMKRR